MSASETGAAGAREEQKAVADCSLIGLRPAAAPGICGKGGDELL